MLDRAHQALRLSTQQLGRVQNIHASGKMVLLGSEKGSVLFLEDLYE